MKRYFKVFLMQLNNNFSIEVQYRKNFIIRVLSQFLFVALQIFMIEIYFRFTNQIGSWSRPEVFLLAGLFRLVEGAFHMFFHSNLLTLPETINQGDMDGLLTRPINTLFLVSTRHHQLYEISTYLSGLMIIIYAMGTKNIPLVFLSVFMSLLGLVALFCIMLMISSLSFYIPRLTAIGSVWDAISKSSRFPLDIFSSKTIFFIAPFLLVATLPSQLVLGKVHPLFWLVQLLGSALLSVIAYKFWTHSLRRYSSASS